MLESAETNPEPHLRIPTEVSFEPMDKRYG